MKKSFLQKGRWARPLLSFSVALGKDATLADLQAEKFRLQCEAATIERRIAAAVRKLRRNR